MSIIYCYTNWLKNTLYSMGVFNGQYFFGMSSYSFKNFLAEKYASSALKCRIGRPHTMPDKVFTVKSKIYMEKLQNLSECPLSGYPARLSTSYIYMRQKVELPIQFCQIGPRFGVFPYIFVISRVLGRFRSYKLRLGWIISSFRRSELLANTC